SESSTDCTMCRRGLFMSLMSSPMRPWTLVASTTLLRLPFRFRASPVASSLRPWLYTLAVSLKLTPAPRDRSMRSAEPAADVLTRDMRQPRDGELAVPPVRQSDRLAVRRPQVWDVGRRYPRPRAAVRQPGLTSPYTENASSRRQ